MKKKCKVVMLPIKKASNGLIFYHERKLLHHLKGDYTQEYIKDINASLIYLYILSDEEIEEGDWCLHRYNDTCDDLHKIIKATKSNLESIQEWWNKIIAASDKSLNLPIPSQKFIEAYVKAYNKGKLIEEVEVKYLTKTHNLHSGANAQWEDVCLKVNHDNTINITIPKNEYTREEVKQLLIKFSLDGRLNLHIQDNGYLRMLNRRKSLKSWKN